MHEFKYDRVKTPATQVTARAELAQQIRASGVPIIQFEGFQAIKARPQRTTKIDPETRPARKPKAISKRKWTMACEARLVYLCAHGASMSALTDEFQVTHDQMIWRLRSLGLSVCGMRTDAAKAKAELRKEWP